MLFVSMLPKRLKRASFWSLAAEEVAYNDDLLTPILLCLPVKSLFRFKSVSKHWQALIADPDFSRSHAITNAHLLAPSGLFLHALATNEDCGFLSLSSSDPPRASRPLATNPLGLKISQSCNGLLCCYTLTLSPDYRYKYYIYNPTTNQYTTLPTSGLSSTIPSGGLGLDFSFSLAFDPTKSPHYKVVCVRGWNVAGSKFYQIEIYLSETGLWHVSGAPFIADYYNQIVGSGIYANGAIHWVSGHHDSTNLYFIIEEERIGRMPMSPRPETSGLYRVHHLIESKDHLHLVRYYPVGCKLDVYELERDYSDWSAKYRIDISPVVSDVASKIMWSFRVCSYVDLIYIFRGETEEDTFLVLRIGDIFVRYNVADKTYKKLCSISDPRFEMHAWFITAYPFTESLCCI